MTQWQRRNSQVTFYKLQSLINQWIKSLTSEISGFICPLYWKFWVLIRLRDLQTMAFNKSNSFVIEGQVRAKKVLFNVNVGM